MQKNRTKGIERAKARRKKAVTKKLGEDLSSHWTNRARKYQAAGNASQAAGDNVTAANQFIAAGKVYKKVSQRNMDATRKNLEDMRKMRAGIKEENTEVSEGMGALNRAMGLHRDQQYPYIPFPEPKKRKPRLKTKIRDVFKKTFNIKEDAEKPKPTHAVTRKGVILSYHTSAKSAYRRADKLDKEHGATVHSVKPL